MADSRFEPTLTIFQMILRRSETVLVSPLGVRRLLQWSRRFRSSSGSTDFVPDFVAIIATILA